jgi:FixJ family two-component response regulator
MLMTGYADIREMLEVQKVPHLAKPFRRNQLLAVIDANIGNSWYKSAEGTHCAARQHQQWLGQPPLNLSLIR